MDRKPIQPNDWTAESEEDTDDAGMSRGWAANWDATALLQTRARRPARDAEDGRTLAEGAVE